MRPKESETARYTGTGIRGRFFSEEVLNHSVSEFSTVCKASSVIFTLFHRINGCSLAVPRRLRGAGRSICLWRSRREIDGRLYVL